MNCSGKFFVPTMIVGFFAAVECEATAVPPKRSGTPNAIANAALAARRVCLRTMTLPFGSGPPPARSLDGVPVDAVHAEERVRQDRGDREYDERDRVVPEADPEDREPERDQHQARQRAAEIRGADREERAAVEVPEPDAERERDEQ